MKRILINATHNEEIRVALCKDNHLYDFDLENRTREQKKANIYKGHITRIEPSLEAAFVEYGSMRQGFLPLREIAPEYLHGNPREDGIKQLLKEGDEVIVQVEKEERGNKGAALSTYISLAGRYLVLMPNNAKAGGISRQISGKVREEMKQIIASLSIPKGMSVIVRTAGLGKGFEDLQNDLSHLLDIWTSIQDQNKKRPSPCLVHQEAGVVTRAVRDYLRDDISEVWIDSENAYNEAANFIAAVMPAQLGKLRKYTDSEPMFARFGIERQIETAYQREVRLPSGGSIVIDQTEALVSIDINSSKSTKGSDVSETAYHTNLEAADEIARQLRLRDMGGLIVIDFIDMNEARHQKDVEKRLIEATRYDRARVQFAEISKFGLMEMSRQRLRPSLEESTGYICPRCHGNGMIRDLRSLSLSIMRQIEQIALKERMGEIQAEVPTEIAAFLLNEKRESLVYLEQDSGTRITILPHAHLESPNFSLHFNPDGFAPSSYERIAIAEEEETVDRGYEVNWQTKQEDAPSEKPSRWQQDKSGNDKAKKAEAPKAEREAPQAVAWLSNLFAPKPQAKLAGSLNNNDAAAAIESLVNAGSVSLGAAGTVAISEKPARQEKEEETERKPRHKKAKKEHKEELDAPKERQEKEPKKKKEDKAEYAKREAGSRRESRGEIVRGETLTMDDAPKADKAAKADAHAKPNKAEKAAKADGDKERKPRQKSGNPNDVVLHVANAEKEVAAAQVVHLSLDGSKPAKPKKSAEKAEAAQAKAHAQSNKPNAEPSIELSQSEPQAEPNLAQTNAAEQNTAEQAAPNAKTAENVAETHIITASSASQVAAVTVENKEPADDAPAEQVAPNAKTDAEQNLEQSKEAKPNAATDKAKAQPATRELVIATRSAPVAHTPELVALAQKMNKAVNDPRVVAALASAPAAISGTAGQFIARTLGADAQGSFVERFIAAVAANHAPKTDTNFANYGYAPLDEAYLSAFDKQTLALGHTSAPQGKTAAEPRPIARRASNDPRGQHPDFIAAQGETSEAKSAKTPNERKAGESVQIELDLLPSTTPTQSDAQNTSTNLDSPSIQAQANEQNGAAALMGVAANAITELSDTIDGVLDGASELASTAVQNAEIAAEIALADIAQSANELAKGVISAVSADTHADADKNTDAIAQSADAAADDASTASESAVSASDKKDANDGKGKKAAKADKASGASDKEADKKGKTSVSSYKDMIENVAGQLLPQVGILTLAQPKAPKTRTRKTSKAAQKSEVRKAGAKVSKATLQADKPSEQDDN